MSWACPWPSSVAARNHRWAACRSVVTSWPPACIAPRAASRTTITGREHGQSAPSASGCWDLFSTRCPAFAAYFDQLLRNVRPPTLNESIAIYAAIDLLMSRLQIPLVLRKPVSKVSSGSQPSFVIGNGGRRVDDLVSRARRTARSTENSFGFAYPGQVRGRRERAHDNPTQTT